MSSILGISAGYHDAAAALVVDGRIVAAAEQERFSRVKHDAAMPVDVLRWMHDEFDLRSIDQVVFYERPLAKVDRAQSMRRGRIGGHRQFHRNVLEWTGRTLWTEAEIYGALAEADIVFDGKVRFCDHHHSHAASAFYPSPFDEATVVCLDGVGEWACSSISHGRGTRLERLRLGLFPHSIGLFYATMTQLAGFKVNSGEYKLMGLAPYGAPRFVSTMLDEVIAVADDGSVELNLRYFGFVNGTAMSSTRLHELVGTDTEPVVIDGVPTELACDLAASAQQICDLVVSRTIKHAIDLTNCRNIALAGGVALNCVSNGAAVVDGACDRIFVQPAASDAGGALGAALALADQLGELRRDHVDAGDDAMGGGFLGYEVTDLEVDRLVDRLSLRSVRLERAAMDAHIAELLTDGRTVAVCRGRAEYGPRALGNRSILADARNDEVQRSLNLAVKQRESFRPFAPAVLATHAAEWFDAPFGDRYMTTVATIRAEHRHRTDRVDDVIERVNQRRSPVPAVTHVDYSARVQLVRDDDPLGPVIDAFRRRTGVPMVVNTSFNRRGEPIVNTAEDAYRCFFHSGIDVLVLNDHVIDKRDGQPPIVDVERVPD